MKRVLALLIAVIMVFGVSTSVFAQTVTRGIKYNVVVDGEKKEFTIDEAVVVDGKSMFTVEAYLNKFGCATLTEENIKKSSEPFSFEGKQFYSLRDVAAGCGLNVFWDSATATAIVVDTDTYDKVKSLIEVSNAQTADAKKIAMEMKGKFDMAMSAGGAEQSLSVPLEAAVKVDIEAPYMEYDITATMAGITDEPVNLKMYDDGENMYMSYDGETYFKQESVLAQSKELIDQMGAMNPVNNALAEDLSYAGLKLSETADGYVLEGDMYVAETFKGIDVDALMKQAYSEIGADISVNFNWPDTMYVKYVMDKDGNIKEMDLKFGFTMEMAMDSETVGLSLNADISIPKFEVNGEFETTVPQEVLDKVTELPEFPEE